MPARGALVACLTGPVTLTSTHVYDIYYSTYTRVPGSVSIHILHTVVLDYGELLAYWFILQSMVGQSDASRRHTGRDSLLWHVGAMRGTLEKGGATSASATSLFVTAAEGASGEGGKGASWDMVVFLLLF